MAVIFLIIGKALAPISPTSLTLSKIVLVSCKYSVDGQVVL